MKGSFGKLLVIQVLLAALTAGKGLLHFNTEGLASSTPGIASGGHGRRTKAKAPNDGRWHMKHHRSRT